MIRWLTALFFSIVVHIGIFFGYSAFSLEKNDALKRKITNVNFLESEIDEEVEPKKRKTTKPKTKNENIKDNMQLKIIITLIAQKKPIL